MAGREGLRMAHANRPATPSQAARLGESGLAVRLQLRSAQPDPDAETDGSAACNSEGAVCLNAPAGLGEPTFGKTLLCQPISLAVITEQSNRCSSPAPEHKNTTSHWVFTELTLAYADQRIYPFAPVNRLNRHQNAHLRRDMNHRSAPARHGGSWPQLRVLSRVAEPEQMLLRISLIFLQNEMPACSRLGWRKRSRQWTVDVVRSPGFRVSAG